MPVRILFPESDLRYCGWGCAVCWVWVPLCPSTSAAGAVTLVLRLRCLLELVILLMPAAVPGVPGPCSVRWISSLVGVSVARPVVGSTGETCHRWRFPSPVLLLVGREVLPVFLGFSRFWIRFFFRPLLVAPSLEALQRGSACFCG